MKYKAHDYQQYATDFIIEHPVSCLILDMGLGKTVITLTALWLLLFDYFEVRRILLIHVAAKFAVPIATANVMP